MADDIDIEEHDILDNPQVAGMCLQFPKIKAEPVDYEDKYDEYNSHTCNENYPIKNEPMDCDSDAIHGQNASISIPTPETIKTQSKSVTAKNLQSNRIILGNKPCPRQRPCPKSKKFNFKAKLKTVTVLLEDWAEKLDRSPCYCKECKTLFATRNAIRDHNVTAHSFQVPVESSTVKEETSTPRPNHKVCTHCDIYFEDDNLLVQHLYDLILAKQKSKEPPKSKQIETQPKHVETQPKHVETQSKHVETQPKQVEDGQGTYMLCQNCFCCFRSRFEFQKHCAKTHGLCDAMEIPFDGKFPCQFCPSVLKSPIIHNTHVRSYHEIEVAKKKKVIVTKAKHMSYGKYQCVHCNLSFNNDIIAKMHQRNFHGQNNKIATFKTKNILPSSLRLIDSGLVPKNVLFKCNKCPKHFLNCSAVVSHSSRSDQSCTEQKIGVWKCEYCNRIFREVDKYLHQLQHKNTTAFQVYVAHENIYSRVLCRCKICDVYFEERTFLKHTMSGCGRTIEVGYCEICKINVNNCSRHTEKHVTRKLILSDFIIIEEFFKPDKEEDKKNMSESSNQNPPILQKQIIETNLTDKRKREAEPNEVPKKRVLMEYSKDVNKIYDTKKKIILYYCSNCRYFLRSAARRPYHLSKKCSAYSLYNKGTCPVCGLKFTTSNQMRLHKEEHKQKNFHLKNFTYICLKTLKSFIPPLPDYSKCQKCNVHFVKHHKCGMKEAITCKLCKKSFNSKAYAFHIEHHKYFAKPAIVPITSIENTIKIENEMLEPTWNILYHCEMCDVASDSYDDVVDHCQKHFNDMQSFDVAIQNCQHCSLNFEQKCNKKHRELHSKQEIDRNSFTILKYDFTKLLTDDWFAMFNPLPRGQMEQILRRSIYATRLVKMRLLRTGSPGYTIYKCQKCEQIVASDEIAAHTEANSCKKQSPINKCSFCGLVFASIRAKEAHDSIHEKPLKVDSLRMVVFNHTDDTDFNKTLRMECKKSSKLSEISKKQFKLVYYRCEKCYCCTSKRTFAMKHSCPPESARRLCSKCNNVFHFGGMRLHNIRHEKMQLTSENVIINSFNVDIKPSERVSLSECHTCKAKYPTHLSSAHQCLEKRSKTKDTKGIPTTTLYRCQKCKAVFYSKENLEKHSLVCNDMINDNHKSENAAVPQKRIYKCKNCLLFMLTEGSVRNHLKHEASQVRLFTQYCQYCGWKFTSLSLPKHVDLHHKALQLTPKDFSIVLVDKKCSRDLNSKKHDQDEYRDLQISMSTINKGKSVHKLSKVVRGGIKPIVVAKAKLVPGNISDDNKKALRSYSRTERLAERYNRKETSKHNNTTPVEMNIVKHDEEKVEQKKSYECLLKNSYEKMSDDNKKALRSYSRKERLAERNNRKETSKHNNTTPFEMNIDKRDEEKVVQKKSYECSLKNSYEKMKNTIFRCAKCNLHYMNFRTWTTHIEINHRVARGSLTCIVCGLTFTHLSFKKHANAIHQGLADGTIKIVTPDESLATMQLPVPKGKDNTNETLNGDKSVVSQSGTDAEQSKQEVSTIDLSRQEKTSPQPKQTPSTAAAKKYTHKIYKCGQCNVHFMAQNTCYIHMLYHAPIDAKEYIECKLCRLPFKIMSLNTHIRKHHNDSFNLDEVLVEEYTNDGGKTPKIEHYYAIDKVQSRLVSTTSDKPDVVCMDHNSTCTAETNDVVETTVNNKTVDKEDTPTEVTEEKNSDTNGSLNKEEEIKNKSEANVKKHECQFCGEEFKSNTSKEFHESLDHLDVEKNCIFCDQTFNTSILNELHLSIKNDTFECCVCGDRLDVKDMMKHSSVHLSVEKK